MKKIFNFKAGVLVAVVLFLSLNAKSQLPNWMNFTNGDFISDIVSDGNILWVATSGGLVKYNKVSGQTEFYNKGNSGLPWNEISAIDIESNGNLWLVTEAGLNMYDGANWILYDSLTSIPGNNFYDVAVDQNGVKWLAASFGLVSFDGTSWTVYDTSNSNMTSNNSYKVFISPSGEKWITSGWGIERFDGTNWILYDYTVAPFSFYNTTDLVFDNNIVYVATHGAFSQGEGLVVFDGSTWSSYTPVNSGLPFDRVECLAMDTSGNLWIGNFETFGINRALVKFDGLTWTSDSTGLPDYLTHLEIDGSNRTFAGTSTTGISEYDGADFTKINSSNSGLEQSGGSELCIDDQQDIYAINYRGFTHFDRQTWTKFDTSHSSFMNSGIYGIARDHTNNTWIGTTDGVVKHDGANWTKWDNSNSTLTNHFVKAITVDPDNAVWVGTQSGPFKFDGNTWTNYFANAGSHIQDVFISHDGDVWMGSPGYGMNRFDRISTWTNYTPTTGGNFQAGALDLNGNVWYGGSNLHKWDGNSWTMFTTSDGLPWNFITALAVDSNNILWIGTQSGLSSFDGNQFTNFFVENSGLTANYISDIDVDAFNNKWIGTSNGISVYNENGVVMAAGNFLFAEKEVRLYPNPAYHFLNVRFNINSYNANQLTITDLLGKQIITTSLLGSPARIDISMLEPGMYIGRLTSSHELVFADKFIVR